MPDNTNSPSPENAELPRQPKVILRCSTCSLEPRNSLEPRGPLPYTDLSLGAYVDVLPQNIHSQLFKFSSEDTEWCFIRSAYTDPAGLRLCGTYRRRIIQLHALPYSTSLLDAFREVLEFKHSLRQDKELPHWRENIRGWELMEKLREITEKRIEEKLKRILRARIAKGLGERRKRRGIPGHSGWTRSTRSTVLYQKWDI